MTEIPEIPAPPGPEPSPSLPPREDPPIGDPAPDGSEEPIGEPRAHDLGGPEDTIAGPGDGTEGPDAPDEPGPRPPGFPDPSGGAEDGSGEDS